MLQAMCKVRQFVNCLKVSGTLQIAWFGQALCKVPENFRKFTNCLKIMLDFLTHCLICISLDSVMEFIDTLMEWNDISKGICMKGIVKIRYWRVMILIYHNTIKNSSAPYYNDKKRELTFIPTNIHPKSFCWNIEMSHYVEFLLMLTISHISLVVLAYKNV